MTVDDVPRKGTGHLLARVSERLKKGISLKVVVDDSSETLETESSFAPCRLTEKSDSSRSTVPSVKSSGRDGQFDLVDVPYRCGYLVYV